MASWTELLQNYGKANVRNANLRLLRLKTNDGENIYDEKDLTQYAKSKPMRAEVRPVQGDIQEFGMIEVGGDTVLVIGIKEANGKVALVLESGLVLSEVE